MVPKSPSSESQRGLHSQISSKTIANKQTVVKWVHKDSLAITTPPTPSSAQRDQTEMPLPQFLAGSNLTANFSSSFLRVWLLISLKVGTDKDPLGNPKELVGTSSTAYPWLTLIVTLSYQLLLGRNLSIHLAPQLL